MGLLRQKKSHAPIINKLNILLPNTSPAANSGSLITKIDVIPVPSSGRDVAVASNNTPTNACPK
jgi:hypothetical protein